MPQTLELSLVLQPLSSQRSLQLYASFFSFLSTFLTFSFLQVGAPPAQNFTPSSYQPSFYGQAPPPADPRGSMYPPQQPNPAASIYGMPPPGSMYGMPPPGSMYGMPPPGSMYGMPPPGPMPGFFFFFFFFFFFYSLSSFVICPHSLFFFRLWCATNELRYATSNCSGFSLSYYFLLKDFLFFLFFISIDFFSIVQEGRGLLKKDTFGKVYYNILLSHPSPPFFTTFIC